MNTLLRHLAIPLLGEIKKLNQEHAELLNKHNEKVPTFDRLSKKVAGKFPSEVI